MFIEQNACSSSFAITAMNAVISSRHTLSPFSIATLSMVMWSYAVCDDAEVTSYEFLLWK